MSEESDDTQESLPASVLTPCSIVGDGECGFHHVYRVRWQECTFEFTSDLKLQELGYLGSEQNPLIYYSRQGIDPLQDPRFQTLCNSLVLGAGGEPMHIYIPGRRQIAKIFFNAGSFHLQRTAMPTVKVRNKYDGYAEV